VVRRTKGRERVRERVWHLALQCGTKHRCGGEFQGLWKAGMWEMSTVSQVESSVRRRSADTLPLTTILNGNRTLLSPSCAAVGRRGLSAVPAILGAEPQGRFVLDPLGPFG
jgi:hypothetical protein